MYSMLHAGGSLDARNLVISKGGLPTPGGAAASGAQGTGAITVPLVEISGTNVTAKAKIVIVVVSQTASQAWVKVVDNATASETVNTGVIGTEPMDVYIYAIDYRGSAKVGSLSRYQEVTPA